MEIAKVHDFFFFKKKKNHQQQNKQLSDYQFNY